jgi:hypothetical protein
MVFATDPSTGWARTPRATEHHSRRTSGWPTLSAAGGPQGTVSVKSQGGEVTTVVMELPLASA